MASTEPLLDLGVVHGPLEELSPDRRLAAKPWLRGAVGRVTIQKPTAGGNEPRVTLILVRNSEKIIA